MVYGNLLYSLIEFEKTGNNDITASVTTDADSPWFSGHFPGDPVLPGIAQLKIVTDLICPSDRDDLRITGLGRIKFRKIVRPGEILNIQITGAKKKGQFFFRITSDDKDVCSGMMFFTHKDNN